ncbi:MAG: malate synthase G [Alphaproteobacteria bacterium]|nr:malate synthase G [Alphaproteobacteria bacterium]
MDTSIIGTPRIRRRRLQVSKALHDFVNDEVIPGTGVPELDFWAAFDAILHKLAPENAALLARRQRLQSQIDDWHRDRGSEPFDVAAYGDFLKGIGYLEAEGPDFSIATEGLDPEMSTIAGPQLVVPLTNARYALNAANARWGSLYDAVYGTDMLPGLRPGRGYDPARGAEVIAFVRDFLDRAAPLAAGSWRDAAWFAIKNGLLAIGLSGERISALADAAQFAGHTGRQEAPDTVLLAHHGLHIEIRLDRNHPVGATDPAGVSDVILEAATTVIMDLEDSVATVDAEDKVAAYRNWLGLMTGTLTAQFEKGGRLLTRVLNGDRPYTAPDGSTLSLPGTALLLVRNVGHLLQTDAVLLDDGSPAPEGIVDAMITAAIGIHGLRRRAGAGRNSAAGSIYIVKPKMHGPEEVGFADRLFDCVEEALGLPCRTIKMGLMDEERRTSANLKECIRAARHRMAFINTGFLDRTGDEIHTSFEAGAMIPKNDMKGTRWIKAYEARNVAVGLRCGFEGRAQIGKGMWAKPDRMAELYEEKIAHARSGASTAWVPSPTAAVLHALHYHDVDVSAVQSAMHKAPCPPVEELLDIPLMRGAGPAAGEIQDELENNLQGILGYVVRWIDQGIGCSKVPDINDVGLMEDRATLRISSQHVANWLRHGICDRELVMATLRRMAKVVDEQNSADGNYRPMAGAWDGLAFQAAAALVFEGARQPNGYTELLLHHYRALAKQRDREEREPVRQARAGA